MGPLLSAILPLEFQGYMTAACEFRDAHGFAFITTAMASDAHLAQGYLAVCMKGNSLPT